MASTTDSRPTLPDSSPTSGSAAAAGGAKITNNSSSASLPPSSGGGASSSPINAATRNGSSQAGVAPPSAGNAPVTKVSPGGGQPFGHGAGPNASSNHFNFFDSNASFGSFGSLESASALPSLPSLLDSKDKAALAAESHRDATVTSTSRGPAPLDNGRLVPPPPSAAGGRQGAPAPAQQSRPAQQSAGPAAAAPQQGRPVARGQPVPQQQQPPQQPQAQAQAQQQAPQPQQQQQQPGPQGSPPGQQSNALVSTQSPENKRIINPVTVPNGQNFVDITEYLNMPQSEAAKKLGIPPSTLSKRWKEAVRNRKWPWRVVCKLDKEIMTLLHNVPQGAPIPEEIEGRLGYLMRKRQEELKPVVIRL